MELQYIMRTIIEICIILQIMTFSQTSRVGNAKIQIRNLAGAELTEVRHDVKRVRHSLGLDKPRRYSSKRKLGATFSLWSTWSICDNTCIKRRERYCKMKNICGYTKQIEEQMCKNCLFHPSLKYSPLLSSDQQYSLQPFKHNNNNWDNTGGQIPIKIQSHTEDDGGSNKYRDENDYYIIRKKNKRNRKRKKKKPIIVEFDDYENIDEDFIDNIGDDNDNDDNDTPKIKIRSNKFFRGGRGVRGGYSNYDKYYRRHRNRFIPREQKNLYENFDDFYYDDNDFFEDRSDHQIGGMLNDNNENFDNNNQYNKNTTKFSPKEKAVIELPSRYKKIYSKWSKWTKCSSKCTSRRYKKCKVKEVCGKEVLREIAYCYTEGSFCQQWLQTHIRKTPPYDINPINYDRKDQDHSINLVAEDYIISGKGYQSPEYAPLKLKCGIPSIRKSMNNMLKIIGGKVSRKGEWPWQVGIFNRFKEIFCGGTLIAPQWVLTAAHCVRKVLYVRLGEHNLDIEDGTEIEFRVSKSFKHPNYDKSTVDSDIALLKLPKPVNSTSWIGFSCMPRPFQPLPKNIQCTVIGWGKRRNRDQSGTSILHQAEVPIISMDHCKAVYYDYTITKNMFCAGHKRGRIDTCAGDSGGPLLCRDTTKSNNPWTIFGITSFGDGCAKKNKFGIYAKVPNYVDWVWSVINCNGNCKPKRRT